MNDQYRYGEGGALQSRLTSVLPGCDER